MKNDDLPIDFTPLLDVTLVLIFFFIMFSQIEIKENKEMTEAKMQEYNEEIEKAKDRENSAEEMIAQLDKNLEIVAEADKRQAQNSVAMIDFQNSGNLKIILDMKDDGWSIRVIREERVVADVENSDNFKENLIKAIKDSGYDKDKTIFCDFIYDAIEPGTNSAYGIVYSALSEFSEENRYFYISNTDLSIGAK